MKTYKGLIRQFDDYPVEVDINKHAASNSKIQIHILYTINDEINSYSVQCISASLETES